MGFPLSDGELVCHHEHDDRKDQEAMMGSPSITRSWALRANVRFGGSERARGW
jgi:hypothetical protein